MSSRAAAAPRQPADSGRKEQIMMLHLNLRTRVEPFRGSGEWEEVPLRREIAPAETAFLLCDVWDAHWCRSAARRCDALAPQINRAVEAARAQGVFIIHAPSECMAFYADTPQRRRMQETPRVHPPEPREITDPPLPIDDSDHGCDDVPPCPAKSPWPWTRQHAAIRIADEDGISDNGGEVYSALRERGITTLLIAGVHTNMCVLKRSFAIRQMTRWGIRCILVRDLTDAMYNPRMPPFVSHEEGTELVIQHIEKYWCPTVLSRDLLHSPIRARRAGGRISRRPVESDSG
jgi:nicotinamidase-related amidase